MQEAQTATVVEMLRQQVANAFLMYMNYKRYHWLSYGPLFRDLHLLFDEHGNQVLGTIDPLGERVRILGEDLVATPQEIQSRATITAAGDNQSTVRAMVEQAHANHQQVIGELRAAVRTAESAADPGSEQLFTEVLTLHEKQEWFLREILRQGDGFIRGGGS